MAKFFALHTTKGDPAKGWEWFGQGAPMLAAAMAAGKLPAKCLTTWNPFAHGRGEYVFCLWEAENKEDIDKILRENGFDDYVTSDVMQVSEIDWADLAKVAQQKAVA
jgi:beta-glucosidase-like glycosyl hydrolase